MHKFLSDIFQISTNRNDRQKVYLDDLELDSQISLEDLDIVLISRLNLHEEENKFIYLYNAYLRIDNHLYAKEKLVDTTQVK